MKVFTPRTVAEVVDSVNQSTNLRIAGVGTKACFASQTDPEQDTLDLSNLVGIERLSAEDQIAIVLAGTTIAELQEELKKHRMCLPLPCPTNYGPLLGGIPGTVGGLLSMNLPHGLYAQYGGPRDWTLGVTVVRADGTVAKSGAQTVKNVAGYDAHKLFVGARGTLGVIAKVILRLYPERGIPAPLCRQVKPWNGEPVAVQRVLRSDFADALHANDGRLYSFDEPSSTLWIDASAPIKRSANDWVLGSVDTCPAWWQTEPAAEGLVRHAKDLFDPNRKLNRHESPR
jgi:glycolate oxidase FAD binding subunit